MKQLYQPIYKRQKVFGFKVEGTWEVHPYAYEDSSEASKIAESEAGKNGHFFVNIININ